MPAVSLPHYRRAISTAHDLPVLEMTLWPITGQKLGRWSALEQTLSRVLQLGSCTGSS